MDLEMLESYVSDGVIKKEEKDGLVVYTCGNWNLCKIIMYPDGSYECDYNDLHSYLKGLVNDIKHDNMDLIDGHSLHIPVFVDEKTEFKYFNNKDVMSVIKKNVKILLKELMNKDSFIRAHLYKELINLGYDNDFRLTNSSVKNNKYRNNEMVLDSIDKVCEEIFNYKYTYGYYFDGETMSCYDDNNIYVVEELDEIVEIFINVFGVKSNEHNELLSNFIWFDNENEKNFKDIFLDSDYYTDVVRDMFNYAMIQYEKQYIKHISGNVKISFTLREAYNVLSDDIKNQLAEEIFYGDKLETKFMSDIINVLLMKCSTKDNKRYGREEIIRFLIEKSSSRVISLMPEDFDVFKDLGKTENEKIVDKYEQLAMNEEENRRSR